MNSREEWRSTSTIITWVKCMKWSLFIELRSAALRWCTVNIYHCAPTVFFFTSQLAPTQVKGCFLRRAPMQRSLSAREYSLEYSILSTLAPLPPPPCPSVSFFLSRYNELQGCDWAPLKVTSASRYFIQYYYIKCPNYCVGPFWYLVKSFARLIYFFGLFI